MTWFKKQKTPDSPQSKTQVLEGMWLKCTYCREIIYRKEVDRNHKVCPKCDYHFPISVSERISLLADPNSFEEWDSALEPEDELEFTDKQSYRERLKISQEKTGRNDAFVVGTSKLDGWPIVLGVFDFQFMGGSMGSVVGEKICRAVARAIQAGTPFVLVTTSGGARMQEGTASLMQMAKTASALAELNQRRIPFVSLLTDPTFGGVTASVAMLGDVIVAEPKALIGFAGPRVIEQTIKQRLPEGFQRAEFLLEHGMIDMIVSRKDLKQTMGILIGHLSARWS